MTSIYEVLRRPLVTEKSNYQNNANNQVVFEVASYATKTMVKEAVEFIFDVEVTRVNMSSGQQVNVGDLLFVVKPLPSAES